MFFFVFIKVQAEKFVIERDDIEKGIVELITQHGITNLVMGAAADKHYSKYGPHKNYYLSIIIINVLTTKQNCRKDLRIVQMLRIFDKSLSNLQFLESMSEIY